MFRQKEVFPGGWPDKTVEAMRKRRFEQSIRQMEPLDANRLETLTPGALARRLEQSWQEVKRRPMYHQQLTQVWKQVLETIRRLAPQDTIVAQIEDAAELEAARALSLRLWANIGLISDKPYLELEKAICQPVARAFAREEHERVRARLSCDQVGELVEIRRRMGISSGGIPACTARPTNTTDVVAGHSPVQSEPRTLKTYGAQEAAPSSCGCAGGSAANDEAELEAITRAVLERLKGIR